MLRTKKWKLSNITSEKDLRALSSSGSSTTTSGKRSLDALFCLLYFLYLNYILPSWQQRHSEQFTKEKRKKYRQ